MIDFAHPAIMSDSSDTMKKRGKLASKGEDMELSKGAESERERSTKRPPTGA